MELNLVEKVFLREEDKVGVRIQIEIEKPAAGSHGPACFLKVVSRHGRVFNNIMPRYVVTGDADLIDIGILPGNVAHSRPETAHDEGYANVNILFDDSEAPKANLVIKKITVSTVKHFSFGAKSWFGKSLGKVEKSGQGW